MFMPAGLLTPYPFLARLAAIVPHPREHQGVLAPASPLPISSAVVWVESENPKLPEARASLRLNSILLGG